MSEERGAGGGPNDGPSVDEYTAEDEEPESEPQLDQNQLLG